MLGLQKNSIRRAKPSVDGKPVTDGQAEIEKQKQELGQVLIAATEPQETRRWAQEVQLLLALICILAGAFIGVWLVVEGPPPPHAPASTAPAPGGAETVALAAVTAPADPSEVEPEQGATGGAGQTDEGGAEDSGGAGESGGSEETGAATDLPVALNEEAAWAFAIVALLVGAFLATGKTINVGGFKTTTSTTSTTSTTAGGAEPAPEPGK